MKKLLLTLFCLFAMFTVKAQCDYNIDLNDSWGDGWSSVTLDVIVDGVVVLDDISCSGSSNTFPFTVNDGSTISIVWNGDETYTNEISFSMRDFLNDAVIASGPYGSTPDIPDALCVVPSCEDASATMSAITVTGATASWDAANGAASYDWEVVPSGNAQGVGVVDSGSAETGLTVSISGLSSATDYDFLISSDCTSDYASAVSFTTLPGCDDTVTFCYSSGATVKQTELESSGNYVTATVNSGSTESGWDNLIIYDTLDATGTVLYNDSGDHTGISVTSTTGLISVWVAADGSVDCGSSSSISEISLTFTCSAPPSCVVPTSLTVDSFTETTAEISWTEAGTATDYNVEVYESGADTTTATPVFTTSVSDVTSASVTGLTASTAYDAYVQADCGFNGVSDFTSATTIYTGHCQVSTGSTLVYVDDFTTTGGVTNISNTSSGLSTGGYGDFTAQSVSGLYGTQSFDIDIESEMTYGGSFHF